MPSEYLQLMFSRITRKKQQPNDLLWLLLLIYILLLGSSKLFFSLLDDDGSDNSNQNNNDHDDNSRIHIFSPFHIYECIEESGTIISPFSFLLQHRCQQLQQLQAQL